MSAKKILVVDDNRSVVRLLELVLQRAGYQVVTAFDGIGALAQVIKQKPDLIILDIIMPGMDGYQVCQRLQRYPETALIPVIMLTVKGHVEADKSDETPQQRESLRRHIAEREHGYDVGASEFISKPIVAKEVLECVRKIFGEPDLPKPDSG